MAQPVLCLQLAVIAAPSLKSRSTGVFHDAPEGCPSNVLILGTAEGCLGGCNRHCITAAGATGSTLLLSWPGRQSQVPRAAAFRLFLGERFCPTAPMHTHSVSDSQHCGALPVPCIGPGGPIWISQGPDQASMVHDQCAQNHGPLEIVAFSSDRNSGCTSSHQGNTRDVHT